ncbi:MAG: peptide deformylase [Clostridiales Family XIII bacterium]|jgi:peptide deformylase|nr:peptide deformylase [Clostridiales Family XIII bacterium]
MALRNILTEEDELLRKKSREVTSFDDRLAELLDDMWETMAGASGVGLAAPQVGILRRAVVIDVTPPDNGEAERPAEPARYELINPVIVLSEGKTLESEGCLSVPGITGMVKRPERVKVTAFDRNGNEISVEGTGMLAKAICHEVDHLEGVLFTDIADSVETLS